MKLFVVRPTSNEQPQLPIPCFPCFLKFTEYGIKCVLSRGKVKIASDDVEAGSLCDAFWE